MSTDEQGRRATKDSTPEDSVRGPWERILDRLELDVAHTEGLLDDDPTAAGEPAEPGPWSPPQVDAPLPEELRPRAQALHARQLDVRRRLAETLRSVRQQRAFTDRVDRAAGPSPAAARFLDVEA